MEWADSDDDVPVGWAGASDDAGVSNDAATTTSGTKELRGDGEEASSSSALSEDAHEASTIDYGYYASLLREDEQFCELSPHQRGGGFDSSVNSGASQQSSFNVESTPLLTDVGFRRRRGLGRRPPPVLMGPELLPSIVDLLMVTMTFVIAVVAAYYSMSADAAESASRD